MIMHRPKRELNRKLEPLSEEVQESMRNALLPNDLAAEIKNLQAKVKEQSEELKCKRRVIIDLQKMVNEQAEKEIKK